MNNNRPLITAQENATSLDLIGKILVTYATKGVPMDATTASALAFLVADCRIYSTIRDQTLLTDENSTVIVAEMKDWKSHEQDLSDAADAIIADLRNSGINI